MARSRVGSAATTWAFVCLAVSEGDLALGGLGDDVRVGDDVAIGMDDKAAADACARVLAFAAAPPPRGPPKRVEKSWKMSPPKGLRTWTTSVQEMFDHGVP